MPGPWSRTDTRTVCPSPASTRGPEHLQAHRDGLVFGGVAHGIGQIVGQHLAEAIGSASTMTGGVPPVPDAAMRLNDPRWD